MMKGMSEGQPHAPERNAAASGTHITDSTREFVHGRAIVRWVGLLYAAYFFLIPAYRHSFAVWMECTVFYAAFLILYFLVAELTGRRQTVAFALFFLGAFLYYPLNQNAYVIFVYPLPYPRPFAQPVPGTHCDDGSSGGGDSILRPLF
jgi:hypothetical protein